MFLIEILSYYEGPETIISNCLYIGKNIIHILILINLIISLIALFLKNITLKETFFLTYIILGISSLIISILMKQYSPDFLKMEIDYLILEITTIILLKLDINKTKKENKIK